MKIRPAGVGIQELVEYLALQYPDLDGDLESQATTSLLSSVKNGTVCVLTNGRYKLLIPSAKNMVSRCITRSSHGSKCGCLKLIRKMLGSFPDTCCTLREVEHKKMKPETKKRERTRRSKKNLVPTMFQCANFKKMRNTAERDVLKKHEEESRPGMKSVPKRGARGTKDQPTNTPRGDFRTKEWQSRYMQRDDYRSRESQTRTLQRDDCRTKEWQQRSMPRDDSRAKDWPPSSMQVEDSRTQEWPTRIIQLGDTRTKQCQTKNIQENEMRSKQWPPRTMQTDENRSKEWPPRNMPIDENRTKQWQPRTMPRDESRTNEWQPRSLPSDECGTDERENPRTLEVESNSMQNVDENFEGSLENAVEWKREEKKIRLERQKRKMKGKGKKVGRGGRQAGNMQYAANNNDEARKRQKRETLRRKKGLEKKDQNEEYRKRMMEVKREKVMRKKKKEIRCVHQLLNREPPSEVELCSDDSHLIKCRFCQNAHPLPGEGSQCSLCQTFGIPRHLFSPRDEIHEQKTFD